eukprot:3561053-Pleurochrysis_carterae.AAC.1
MASVAVNRDMLQLISPWVPPPPPPLDPPVEIHDLAAVTDSYVSLYATELLARRTAIIADGPATAPADGCVIARAAAAPAAAPAAAS